MAAVVRRRDRDAAFAVDRHRQAEAVLVVGVVADEVDASGRTPGVVVQGFRACQHLSSLRTIDAER